MQHVEEKKSAEDAIISMQEDSPEIRKARQGLLKALQQHFSSTPIDIRKVNAATNNNESNNDAVTTNTVPCAPPPLLDPPESLISAGESSVLTQSEKQYIQALLQASTDPALLLTVSQRLNDKALFPAKEEEEEETSSPDPDPDHRTAGAAIIDSTCATTPTTATTSTTTTTAQTPADSRRSRMKHRDSGLQQELFRLHESAGPLEPPSQVLQRLVSQRNSILESAPELVSQFLTAAATAAAAATATATTSAKGRSWDILDSEADEVHDFGVDVNPFKDISSWLDGSQGIEVSDSGILTPTTAARANKARSFKILGTSADDVSCHPHVLSPPAMESLVAFVPDTLTLETNHHWWLKYSLVRDGASLWQLLRQVRASTNSILAIETTDGHVLGSFTTQSWRYSSGWYGSKDSFLWKMRQSRSAVATTARSVVQQACQEGEIQVFPYRAGNVAVQYCSKENLMLGQGELLPVSLPGQHFGYGLSLDANLRKGSTSTSETFGNPCLVDVGQRGARFEIANIEVWTLTPHAAVEEAEQSELSTLFLESGRSSNDKKLNVLGILVGGPI